jgi:hypothetical protein
VRSVLARPAPVESNAARGEPVYQNMNASPRS